MFSAWPKVSLSYFSAAAAAALQHLTEVLKIYSLLICWDKVIVVVVVFVAVVVAAVALIVSCIFACMISNFICSLCICLMEFLVLSHMHRLCACVWCVLGFSICVRHLPQSKLLLNVHKEVFIVYSFRGLVTNRPLCSDSSRRPKWAEERMQDTCACTQ